MLRSLGASRGVSKHAAPLRRLYLGAALVVLAAAFDFVPALAVQPGEQLQDPKLEARARALGEELRCMVCQNQSIDDSDAPLAKDLRLLVRERVKTGDSDDEVLAFLTARYGEFVLLRPRLRGETLLLWGLAPAILGIGLVGYLVWAFRRRKERPSAPSLSEAERKRLEALLAAGGEGGAANPPGSRLT
ncbi:cytochrome c-type biogenesis protein [Hansschlegelia zhihuaiae]|uniref:Cytochrome c-type biogenesis protein n=1 Tax=Hansschlegelia zhihuaiae TaxID=405005 RepID=A0A4Q0MPI7_9HYPH|nr:cytochrome c-type biogenesis protein [Hansschlegelia zhihuaiae]RXF75694.1 cytochrome c-type biogenesis protein CcmH [Hansschlegelia zhihuaiae]